MNVEIVPAGPQHIHPLLAACRERAGFEKLGAKAFDFLRQCIQNSAEAWAGFIDGNIACVWGISRGSMLGDSAFVWLNTTDELEKHPFVFVRHSQIRLAELRQRYHYIYGFVQVDNEPSVKWLRWLGFKLGDVEYVNGYVLRKFSMIVV
jgi:hypothetical protein